VLEFHFCCFLNKHFRQNIAGSTGPIFTKFSPYGKYLIIDYRFYPLFPIAQGMLPWQLPTNFRVKIGEVGRLTFIRRVGIPKRSEISQFRFQELICDDLATLCKNMMNVGPVTPEFNRAKDVHPSSISSLASGVTASTARPCGDHY